MKRRALLMALLASASLAEEPKIFEAHYCRDHPPLAGGPSEDTHLCRHWHTAGSSDGDECWNLRDDCESASCAREWEMRHCTAAEAAGIFTPAPNYCYRLAQVCGDGDEIWCQGHNGSTSSRGAITCKRHQCDESDPGCEQPVIVNTYTCGSRPPGQ